MTAWLCVEEPKKEPEEEEDIICDVCEIQFLSASSLISHKNQKHDPKICPNCGVVVKHSDVTEENMSQFLVLWSAITEQSSIK